MFYDSFPLTNISVCRLEFSGDGFKLTKQDPWRTGKCFCDSFPLTMSLCFAASLAVKTHNRLFQLEFSGDGVKLAKQEPWRTD